MDMNDYVVLLFSLAFFFFFFFLLMMIFFVFSTDKFLFNKFVCALVSLCCFLQINFYSARVSFSFSFLLFSFFFFFLN